MHEHGILTPVYERRKIRMYVFISCNYKKGFWKERYRRQPIKVIIHILRDWGIGIEYQNDYLGQVKVKERKFDLHFNITRVYTGYLFVFFYLWTNIFMTVLFKLINKGKQLI